MSAHDHHTYPHSGSAPDDSSVTRTTVIEVSGVHWASSKAVAEQVLSRRPGVLSVLANPVAQTATVTYDPRVTTVAKLADWVRECGYHCAGQSVPQHVSDPMTEPGTAHAGHEAHTAHEGMTPHEEMGHGGHHSGMSMADMARDLRDRFLVALVGSVPILLWSPIGREVLGFDVAAPFGLRDDVFSLALSLPVIFYSGPPNAASQMARHRREPWC